MSKGRAWLFIIFAVVVAFGAGYGWQYMRATELQQQLATVQNELEINKLYVNLGQIGLLAQSGDYEAARRRASAFFTQLQERVDAMGTEDEARFEPILAQRDEIITALSRANPQSVDLLAALFARISGSQPPPVQQAEPMSPMQPAAPAGSTAADTMM